jgi:hypothetical protein
MREYKTQSLTISMQQKFDTVFEKFSIGVQCVVVYTWDCHEPYLSVFVDLLQLRGS